MLASKVSKAIAPIKQRIVCVKRQMRACTIQYNKQLMESVIYYDQIEELSAKLNKLRLQEQKLKQDVLDEWCLDNPRDGECNVFDH